MNLVHVEETRLINEKLEQIYHRHTVVNKPNFRLVFAGDIFEKRAGEHSVYCGDLFLRTEYGIHEVKKYEQLLDDNTWVLERLIPNHHTDVMEGDYVYEPIYAFPKGVFPIWRAIEFFMQNVFHKKNQPQTQKEAEALDNQSKERETKEIKERLEALDSTPVGTGIAGGHAISMVGLDGRSTSQGEKDA